MMDPLRTKILISAVFSRVFILVLSFISNLLIPDHDAYDVFRWIQVPLNEEDAKPKPLDWLFSSFLDGLTKWDGQHFLHIANNGYTYEKSIAFFPLFPKVVSIGGHFIHWCQIDYDLISFTVCLMISAACINFLGFILSALTLFELSRKVLKDEYLAYKAALFFCINPASIFFTAAYSETLYSLFSFYAMLKIEKSFKLQVSVLLCLPSATRANGIVNIGFSLYKGARIIAKEIFMHGRLGRFAETSTTVANILGDALVPSFFSLILGIFPFVLTQWYAFMNFCRLTKSDRNTSPAILDYARLYPDLKLPSDEPSSWCFDPLPMPYSYVQDTYWNVGFLKCYQFKQIPNFIIAIPIFYLIFWRGAHFLQRHKMFCKKLGLNPFIESNDYAKLLATKNLPKEAFVYVAHSLVLGLFCALFIHIQVSTRLLCSSCPVIYWYAASLTTPKDRRHTPLVESSRIEDYVHKIEKRSNLESAYKCVIFDETPTDSADKWLRVYFLSYAVVGTVMFSNFLPWT